MSAKKHTPGPWLARGYDVLKPAGRFVAYTGPTHTTPEIYPQSCKLEDEANARLIAAAPDLLDALKLALECGDACGMDAAYPSARAEIVEAIAKAEGRA